MKKTIKLTESQLKMVVNKTIKNIVNEDDSMVDTQDMNNKSEKSAEEILAQVIHRLNLDENNRKVLTLAISNALSDSWLTGYNEGLETGRGSDY